MEIAAIVAAVGDKVVVAGEEEAVARLRREPERGTFMLSRNDHKQHHDTPGFYCLRRYLVQHFDFLFWTGKKDIVWPLLLGYIRSASIRSLLHACAGASAAVAETSVFG